MMEKVKCLLRVKESRKQDNALQDCLVVAVSTPVNYIRMANLYLVDLSKGA